MINSIHSVVDSSFFILSSPLVPFSVVKLIFALTVGVFSKTGREFLGLLGISLVVEAWKVQEGLLKFWVESWRPQW